jgi:hypothetical protein
MAEGVRVWNKVSNGWTKYNSQELAEFIKSHSDGVSVADFGRFLLSKNIKTSPEGVLASMEMAGYLLSEDKVSLKETRLYYHGYCPNITQGA